VRLLSATQAVICEAALDRLLLVEFFARSSQAATTAANSFFEGGFPAAVCHPRSSEEALAGITASPVAQATRPNNNRNATPRILDL